MTEFKEVSPGIFVKMVGQSVEKACERKKVYDNQEAAQAAADYASNTLGEEMQPYKCRYCSCIHIGHKIPQKRQIGKRL